MQPDLDRRLTYTMTPSGLTGICRLRAWHDRNVAVVTELDDNPGPSVTNAIESVADAVESLLGVRFAEHPTLMVPVRWQILEHYERASGLDTLDVVTFAGRDDQARLRGPSWAALRSDRLPWLRDSLAQYSTTVAPA